MIRDLQSRIIPDAVLGVCDSLLYLSDYRTGEPSTRLANPAPSTSTSGDTRHLRTLG